MKNLKFITISLLVVLILSSCSSVGQVLLTKEKYPPKPKDYNVEYYYGKDRPSRDYIEIARIDATYNAITFMADIGKGILNAMLARCRELGGDAIIQVEYHIGWVGSVGQGAGNGSCIAIVWQ